MQKVKNAAEVVTSPFAVSRHWVTLPNEKLYRYVAAGDPEQPRFVLLHGYDRLKDSLSVRFDGVIGQFARLLPAANPALPLSRDRLSSGLAFTSPILDARTARTKGAMRPEHQRRNR